METKPNYDIVLSQETLDKIVSYQNNLIAKKMEPGSNLKKVLDANKLPLNELSIEKFIESLLLTKKPIIFATHGIKGGGIDWNDTEFQILGDMNIAMNVKIYDNGVWVPKQSSFCVHNPPLNGTLLFTPGPVLRSKKKTEMNPDMKEIIVGNAIDQNKYNRLIERRLMPLFYYANENAKNENKQAFITCCGIGCGVFAGRFRGRMAEHLNQALRYILGKHAKNFDNIACIYFDSFDECTNETQKFDSVSYRVRPTSLNPNKPQLCDPKHYEEIGDDFSDCKLFKVVAWDHVSFPGNNYFKASRKTDDGVSAAATNSMEILTGIEGRYSKGDYFPPEGNKNWEEVVNKHNITLRAKANVKISTAKGSLIDLKEHEKSQSYRSDE